MKLSPYSYLLLYRTSIKVGLEVSSKFDPFLGSTDYGVYDSIVHFKRHRDQVSLLDDI